MRAQASGGPRLAAGERADGQLVVNADAVVRVDRVIPADAGMIFAVLTSPARHTELDGSAMLRGSARGPDPLYLGAIFTMSMSQARLQYRSVNRVTVFEQDRAIAWETGGDVGPVRIGGHWWRYDLEPVAGGTRVTHSYEWGRARAAWLTMRLPRFPQRMARDMPVTLERLEHALARSA